jgi:hypothetical protein
MMADVEEVEVVLAHHEPSRTDRLARIAALERRRSLHDSPRARPVAVDDSRRVLP